ncbi:hypothetical protein F5I97DRAFT_1815020 [Phlebopus sp. FC_14]|nr:hypothetical protein F5I97DRAFT_1815020 [Phlebopus sp. FC_14]
MAESMVETFDISGNSALKTEEQVAGGKRASVLIGGALVHFLGTKKHKEDPILIQIAFQAFFAYFLRYIASAWIIGGNEEANDFIQALYTKVRDTEAQAIAGRWRALTRAHFPRPHLDELQLTAMIASKITTGLSDILLAAGCSASQAELAKALSDKFTEKISILVSLAIRVNKIIGEDVTSGNLEVLAVHPAAPFNAEAMEDSYDDGVSARSARSTDTAKVLCATDLGLRKRTRVAVTGEKEKQWEMTLLLKPKVALESVVDIMDE